jgi:hypothetical protein
MKGGVAARAVTDLVVGHRVEVLVGQPGWVVVLLREAGGASVLVGNCEFILGIGKPTTWG